MTSAHREVIGRLRDGSPVHAHTIGGDDRPQLRILDLGATVASLHAFGAESVEEVRLLREVLEGKGGALVVERAPGSLRQEVGTWGTLRTPAVIGRALKERFDPNGVLAPGRMAY